MTEHVVVAVDGGPASAAAFDWVVDRARTVEMRLEITTVVDINWFPQPNPDPVLAEDERIVDEAGKRVVTLDPFLMPGSLRIIEQMRHVSVHRVAGGDHVIRRRMARVVATAVASVSAHAADPR